MKNSILILFLIITIKSVAQDNTKLISGKVLLDSIPVPDVHIVNKNTREGTITNDNGQFEVYVSEGDTLIFSHLNLEAKEIVIDSKILNDSNFIIKLVEQSVALDEVIVGNTKSIFHIDSDIMPHNLPKVSAATLKLPYANTVTKKDNSIIKIRSGFSIGLDGILNRASGAHKRTKIAKKLEQEDIKLLQIRKLFTDDFFVTDLGIKKAYINRFLNYCVDKNIIYYFKKEDQLKLIQILIDESKEFPYQIEKDSTLLTKK